MRGASKLCRTWPVQAHARRRNAALRLARLGVRLGNGPILLRSSACARALLSRRYRGRAEPGEGAIRGRNISRNRRGKLRVGANLAAGARLLRVPSTLPRPWPGSRPQIRRAGRDANRGLCSFPGWCMRQGNVARWAPGCGARRERAGRGALSPRPQAAWARRAKPRNRYNPSNNEINRSYRFQVYRGPISVELRMPAPGGERLPLLGAFRKWRAGTRRIPRGCGLQSKMLEGMTQMQHLRRGRWSAAPLLRHLPRSLLGPTLLSIAVGVAYFVAARFGLALLTAPDGVAVFWPAAGISAGTLIALGPSARGPVVVGTMAATVAANLLGDRNVAATMVFTFCNAAEAVIAAWLIERQTRAPFSLDALRRVLALFTAAILASGVSGIRGSLGFMLFHPSAAGFLTTWSNWFVSAALGIITVAPVVIGLISAMREPLPQHEVLEGLAALIFLAVVSAVGFASPTQFLVTILLPALVVPFLI